LLAENRLSSLKGGMVAPEIETSVEQGVATIVLNRPAVRNALNVHILDSLPGLLCEMRDNDAVRCVVITGAGEDAFSAGGDISGLSGGFGTPNEMVDKIEAWAQAPVLLHEMPKPTLAAVNGVAAGAGMALALACDLRIASDNARFITAFAKLAISGDFGGSYFLTQLVGPAKARELYFLSDSVEAKEAASLGLVNWLVEAKELRSQTQKIASRLASMPSRTARAMKQNLNASLTANLRTVVRLEAESIIETSMSGDTLDAVKSFLKKNS
jgi:2-(1,2-epoxy-1,2-dihydrophenyl)acetyl-CoA isomerase